MKNRTAANREEAKGLSEAHPQDIVVDQSTGHIWTGPATLVPVKGEANSYICYADHGLEALGAVRRNESGLWTAHRYGEVVAMRPTMRDAAIDLVQHTAA